jgi:hypothetical protein
VVDNDEGLDGETVFLYIFLGAILVLLGVVGHHYFSLAIVSSFNTSITIRLRRLKIYTILDKKRKRVSSSRSQSNGVNNHLSSNGQQEQVDFEWIPKGHLQQTTPRTSPRLRQRQKADAENSQASDTQ